MLSTIQIYKGGLKMYLEIILICGLIFSLQQLRIIDLEEDRNQWKNTSLLNQKEKYKNEV